MKTKPLFIGLITIFLPVLLLTGCGQDPQPNQQTVSRQAPSQPTAKADAWPFISATQPEAGLAKNVTARNFLLIFDGSGSMAKSKCSGASRKIDVAKKAVVAWSKSLPAESNLGLYAFHNGGVLTLPLSSGKRDAFMQSVNSIVAGQDTPLTEAVLHAYKTFTEQGRRQLGYGDYTIVIVTDGIANDSKKLQKAVEMILARTPINIYSIGFCIDNRHSLNQPGRTSYKSANNPEQLQKSLQEVLAESETFEESGFSN